MISTASPIGRALLNKEEGDEALVTTPNGSRRFEVVKLRDDPRRGRSNRSTINVITPDTPDRVYSTRLRTALVLTGSGTSAAYHAGVLRALHEAGVKWISPPAAGLASSARSSPRSTAARGSGKRTGSGKARGASQFYGWREPLRVAGWALAVAAAVLAIPLVLAGSRRRSRHHRSAADARRVVRRGDGGDVSGMRAGSRPCSRRPRCRLSCLGSRCSRASIALGTARWARSEASARGGAVAGPDRESPAACFGGPISSPRPWRTGARPSCGT